MFLSRDKQLKHPLLLCSCDVVDLRFLEEGITDTPYLLRYPLQANVFLASEGYRLQHGLYFAGAVPCYTVCTFPLSVLFNFFLRARGCSLEVVAYEKFQLQ